MIIKIEKKLSNLFIKISYWISKLLYIKYLNSEKDKLYEYLEIW